MANYYCEYCGTKFGSVSSLTTSPCTKHPNGTNKGKHKLYEGSEKSKYMCKYCGKQERSIRTLVMLKCHMHPKGANKYNHEVAL